MELRVVFGVAVKFVPPAIEKLPLLSSSLLSSESLSRLNHCL